MIEIIQKWKGNIPNFIKIAKIIIVVIILFRFSKFMEKEMRKILEEIL